jgi:hypothetical protein
LSGQSTTWGNGLTLRMIAGPAGRRVLYKKRQTSGCHMAGATLSVVACIDAQGAAGLRHLRGRSRSSRRIGWVKDWIGVKPPSCAPSNDCRQARPHRHRAPSPRVRCRDKLHNRGGVALLTVRGRSCLKEIWNSCTYPNAGGSKSNCSGFCNLWSFELANILMRSVLIDGDHSE